MKSIFFNLRLSRRNQIALHHIRFGLIFKFDHNKDCRYLAYFTNRHLSSLQSNLFYSNFVTYQDLCIGLIHDVTIFLSLYLECQFRIRGISNLPLDVTNNIS